MVTSAETLPVEPTTNFICPQCQAQVNPRDIVCPECGVDLAWAAAVAERQVLFGLGAVSPGPLDAAGTEQEKHLQEALRASLWQADNQADESARSPQQALQQLAALSELKSNLVGNLAHNLRSPIVPIQGYGSLLADGRLGTLNKAQQEAVEAILRAVAQLETVIGEMGQLSYNLMGRVRILPTTFALPDLVERLKRFFTPKAASADIQLRFDLPPDLPYASGDVEKIWWVLFQLFDNALRLMPAGGEVALTARAADGRVKIAVHDSGPCLPPAQLHAVLHLPPESISHLADSRGWALAQIKRIVEAHGASLSVESRPAEGTAVAFELPASDVG
jgi:signal transduction histidine kinase